MVYSAIPFLFNKRIMRLKILILLCALILTACGTSEQTAEVAKADSQEVYVFDYVEEVDSLENVQDSLKAEIISPVPPKEVKPLVENQIRNNTNTFKYLIQVGAFSTRERAEKFVIENQSKVNFLMNISLNKTTNLFVVQSPAFNNRTDAEIIKDNIWQIQTFKDAFIITVEN